MAKEDFDLFWNTHLHTTGSSNQSTVDSTVLYWHSLREETTNFPWGRRESTPRLHALSAVSRDLMTQVRVATRKTVLSVTVLHNVSPCADCVAELLKAVALSREKKVKLDLTIAFVALHRVRRPSCTQRGYQCAGDVCLNESNDNALALRVLVGEGVKVATFNPSLWQFLYTFVGLGVPATFTPNSFLSGKYTGGVACQHRMAEDSLMANELQAILTGMQITSGTVSPDPDGYTAEWKAPKLPAGKPTEYRLVYKKVSVKNKDAEDKQWRIQQTLSSAPTKMSVRGELTSQRLSDLDRDSFYELTVEALLGAGVVTSAKRLFRTDDKVNIPSLTTPKKPVARSNPRLSGAAPSPRTPNGLSEKDETEMGKEERDGREEEGARKKPLVRSNSTRSASSPFSPRSSSALSVREERKGDERDGKEENGGRKKPLVRSNSSRVFGTSSTPRPASGLSLKEEDSPNGKEEVGRKKPLARSHSSRMASTSSTPRPTSGHK